jgi:hypothetical protein
MMRFICAVAGLLAMAAPGRPDVDAVTFVKAFRAGQADQYKNMQVSGSGVSFHGVIRERVADGSVRTSLVVTLGATSGGQELTLLRTWDEFVAAERDRTTLVVALSGPDLPAVPQQPAGIRFSGVYDGQVRTIMRVPQAGERTTGDSGPCPGEEARDPNPGAAFYCAPLLTAATATIIQQYRGVWR